MRLLLLSRAAPAFEDKRYLLTQGWADPRALESHPQRAASMCRVGYVGLGDHDQLSCPGLSPLYITARHSTGACSGRWKGSIPGKFLEPFMPHGTSQGTPALLSSWVSALPLCVCVFCLCFCRGMGRGSRKKIHLYSNRVISFLKGFTFHPSSQHTVPWGYHLCLSFSPPSFPLSLSAPRNLVSSRK